MNDDRLISVLVADDEEGMRLGVRRALLGMNLVLDGYPGKTSFSVDIAADGTEAREKLALGYPDLLLLDHSMPGCTGMEILEDLRQQDSPPLTIMITAYASLDMAVKATKQGAFDFLAKPFTPSELRHVIEKATRHLIADRAARRLAAEKTRVRFEFISVLAHELKAPLGAVEGYLRLLDEGIGTDDPIVSARVIKRSIVRLEGMRKLIFDLLDLTRIESGQKKRDLQTVDVTEAVQQVIETFSGESEARSIAVRFHAEGNTEISCEPGELEIMLNNLVSNAIKYNRDNGQVTIAITGDQETMTIAVTDTGIGMSEEETGRLFGEFVRIKNDQTRGILGSGLGLSILRRLARLSGGDVSVTSIPNEGSTFTVTLNRSGMLSEKPVPRPEPEPS